MTSPFRKTDSFKSSDSNHKGEGDARMLITDDTIAEESVIGDATLSFNDEDSWTNSGDQVRVTSPVRNSRLTPEVPAFTEVSTQNEASTSSRPPREGGDFMDTVKEKVDELELEITKFREQNAILVKLRAEREQEVKALEKERCEVKKKGEAETKQVLASLEQERAKLKRERQLVEVQRKARGADLPNRQERKEVTELKQEIESLRQTMQQKEERSSALVGALRTRIKQLEQDKKELAAQLEVAKSAVTQKTDNIPLPFLRRTKPLVRTASESNLLQPLGIETKSTGRESKTQINNNEGKKEVRFDLDPGKSLILGSDPEFEHKMLSDGTVEKIYASGVKEVIYSNGTRKEYSADGKTVLVFYFNGDVKHAFPDQRVVYYYSESRVSHTTFPDGKQVIYFPSGQLEKHYPDGAREINFPDNTVKYLFPDGSEETVLEDGTTVRVDVLGTRTINFPNGQREIHTSAYKKREYPDGTCKMVYPDGRQETRYANGRVRIKAADGTLLHDSTNSPRSQS